MMIARQNHQRREDLPETLQQSDPLFTLIERLRGLLQRQLAERDTSIDWEDGEIRDGDYRH